MPPLAAGAALAALLQPVAVAPQSALAPAGPAADRIDLLWDVMLWSSLVISALTVAALAYALFRRRRPDELPPEADRPADPRGELANEEGGGRGRTGTGRPRSEQLGVRWMIAAGVVFPAVVLTALLLVTLPTLGALTAGPDSLDDDAIVIEVTGRQWWWEVRYLDDVPSNVFATANELHVPVGRRVRVLLRTDDVIHSFWVPGLHGKTDMIPGRTNVMWLQADSAGEYRGQCAEFCGVQHAKMAFVVVAEPEEAYARWVADQRRPAAAPATPEGRRAQQAFLNSGCILCHTVRGTLARGELGPDLTHLASRRTLAAGELPMNLGNLHGWIADPQALKPGNHMPALPLDAEQLHLIASYLAGLR